MRNTALITILLLIGRSVRPAPSHLGTIFGQAFLASPQLLPRDENSTGLMPIFEDKVFDALSELNRRGVSILLVEQNERKSLSTVSRGYVLETGRISLEGSSEELRSNPEVQKAYLGI